MIEKEALSDAMRHGDVLWEEQVQSAFENLCRADRSAIGPQAQDWGARHKVFHLSLISACRSPWLIRMHELLYDQTERYRLISAVSGRITHAPDRNKEDEHRLLAETIISRKVGPALFLMEAHLRKTADRVEAAIAFSAEPPTDVASSAAG